MNATSENTSGNSADISELRFGFGKNWADYVQRHFSESRVQASLAHMLSFLNLPTLEGRTFLDIGSGSGLHSLAAYKAGAERIHSFDYDRDSVRTTSALREMVGSPAHWTVEQGSVLDEKFMRSLEAADVVYSWGVLHHTGKMWEAIRNASIPMRPDAVFYVALYTSDVFTNPSPEYWLDIKRRYNLASPLRKGMMEWAYAVRRTILPSLVRGRNPFPQMYGSSQQRGMTYWTDLRDWLGGWPMEFAGIAETKEFAANLGLELLNVNAGEANTEYLFRRGGVENYWDAVRIAHKPELLPSSFTHRLGYAYWCPLPVHASTSDNPESPRRSKLMVYEDGKPIGFAHQPHRNIEKFGQGRYSHWKDGLLFSATDGTDPRTNGRKYSVSLTGLTS